MNRTMESEQTETIIVGRNPVMEALRSERNIEKVLIADGAAGSARKIAGMARDQGIPVQFVPKKLLDRTAGDMAHQGAIAFVSSFEYCEPEDLLRIAEEKNEPPFLVILDGIEDPHNLGAVIRTADAAGAHGVIIPRRRAVSVTVTVEKAAAGATAYVPVARAANLSRTIESLKKQGVWTAAVDMDGDTCWDADLKGPIAVVIGSEGRGVSRLVKESCDFCISMPMAGHVNSLNASNAAALAMYEILRQRREQR